MLEEFGRPLEVQDVDLAEPKAGEVLVRLVACGVCHTDLYTASGAGEPAAEGGHDRGVRAVRRGLTGLHDGPSARPRSSGNW